MNGPPDPNGGSNRNPYRHPTGRGRTRTHERLLSNLKRIPAIENVRTERSGTGISNEIVGDVETMVFASGVIPHETAHVKVNWWPQPEDETDLFEIHYWEPSGCDAGWHRQPNNHVDGLDHFQWRPSSDADYEYEPVTFEPEAPVGILWDAIDDRLPTFLEGHYE